MVILRKGEKWCVSQVRNESIRREFLTGVKEGMQSGKGLLMKYHLSWTLKA